MINAAPDLLNFVQKPAFYRSKIPDAFIYFHLIRYMAEYRYSKVYELA